MERGEMEKVRETVMEVMQEGEMDGWLDRWMEREKEENLDQKGRDVQYKKKTLKSEHLTE